MFHDRMAPVFENLEELSADDSLEAALGVAGGLSLADAAGDVLLRGRVQPHPDQRDGVESPVELTITTAVEAMLVREAGGGRDRGDAGEGGEGSLGAEPPRVGPSDENLCCGDRADAEQVEELRRFLPHQLEDLAFELLGLSLEVLDPLGGGVKGADCHAVLDGLSRPIPQASAPCDLGGAGEFAQLGAEVVRRGDDQSLELVDRGGGGENRTLAGGQQDSQGFTLAAGSGLDDVFGGQGLTGRADSIEHVGLAPAPDSGALGAADLDNTFTSVFEEGSKSGAVAADAFQCPAPSAGNVLTGEVQQAPVAASVSGCVDGLHDGADRADAGCGESVAVGVDADDAIDLFCEHGHAVVLLQDGTTVVGVGLGGVTAWRNCDESRRKADKLLIQNLRLQVLQVEDSSERPSPYIFLLTSSHPSSDL